MESSGGTNLQQNCGGGMVYPPLVEELQLRKTRFAKITLLLPQILSIPADVVQRQLLPQKSAKIITKLWN
jgi:hypothetical protein